MAKNPRIFQVILGALAALALTASCGDDEPGEQPGTAATPTPTVTVTVTPTPTPTPTMTPVSPRRACELSGGTVVAASCCKSVGDFPNTCTIGACGCSPEFSHDVLVCECPDGTCWNGRTCE
jgi:hypothetical protein